MGRFSIIHEHIPTHAYTHTQTHLLKSLYQAKVDAKMEIWRCKLPPAAAFFQDVYISGVANSWDSDRRSDIAACFKRLCFRWHACQRVLQMILLNTYYTQFMWNFTESEWITYGTFHLMFGHVCDLLCDCAGKVKMVGSLIISSSLNRSQVIDHQTTKKRH